MCNCESHCNGVGYHALRGVCCDCKGKPPEPTPPADPLLAKLEEIVRLLDRLDLEGDEGALGDARGVLHEVLPEIRRRLAEQPRYTGDRNDMPEPPNERPERPEGPCAAKIKRSTPDGVVYDRCNYSREQHRRFWHAYEAGGQP